jgi:PAS domain S-box-containing protein
VSAEIEQAKLIERLMTVALENAGANRGLLISPRNDDYLVEAAAEVADGEITVHQEPLPGSAAPESVIRYVLRTRESVMIDDARSSNQFAEDEYLVRQQPCSVFCLPLVRQVEVIGVLYLENTLTSHVFTPDRTALLALLASQIAISLENTRLYNDLREREAKIRRLVDSNVIGITVTELEGQMIEANDAFLEMVGHAREDLISGRLHWTDLTPREWHDRTLRAIAELKRIGTVQPYEKEYFRKDGGRVPVLIGGAAFGEPRDHVMNFVVDLTDRKRAEVALRDSEEALRRREKELRDILETIPAMTVTVLPDGTDVFIGKRFVEYSGLSADKARRSGWQAAAHPDDVDAHVSEWRSSLASGEPIEIETRFRRADGQYRWFLARAVPLRDDQSNILNWYEVLTDIEDRKQAEMALRDSEQALRRSEAWLTQAQTLSHTGNWVYNATTMLYLYWSEESYRIWGFDPLEGVPSREDTWQRIHPDDRDRVWEAVQEALRQKKDFAAEFRIVLPGGTVKYLEGTTRHVFSALGALVETISTNVDVTDRKRAQDERERLRQLEADLARMNRLSMMGELAASLAHEITQPFGAARNNARAALNFLDSKPPDLGEVREALGCIVDDIDRAGNIIERIREQVKKAPPRKDHFDLNEAINEVIGLARSAITRNVVSVQTRLAEGQLPVDGDRVQLQQVVLNLILNAVEAMGSAREGPREMSISTEQSQANGILVAIRDSGPGIESANLDRVFEAFYTTKSSGVGMGLSICRSIVDAHGGRLWASANVPRGAIFQFTLPSAGDLS